MADGGRVTGARRTAPAVVVVVALRIEGLAVGGPVERAGMGPRRAARAADGLGRRLPPAVPVVVAGVCGGLGHDLAPGTVLVADRVGRPDGVPVPLAQADAMVRALAAAGRAPVTGGLVSVDRLAQGRHRARLAAAGARVVDMESATLVAGLGGRPVAVVRTVADTPDAGMVRGGMRALAALRGLRPAFEAWAAEVGPGRHGGPSVEA